jgi:hypothetical protein
MIDGNKYRVAVLPSMDLLHIVEIRVMATPLVA